MEGFKIKCSMCGADDVEIFESDVRVDYKKIGFNISFYCNECNWEEVFKEIREETKEDIDMKINRVIVNKLPSDCSSCTLHEAEYCKIKSAVTGSEWVDLYSDSRDSNCPLEEV